MSQEEDLLELSNDMLAEAEYLLKENRFKGTISRAYYASFNAVKAMLLVKDSKPKTHQGVASEFGRLFKEEITAKLTRDYSELQRMREQADYGSGEDFGKKDAEFSLETSKEVIEHAEEIINR